MSKPTKITKEIILEKALEIIRTQGIEKVSNREIAKKLNSSIRPIYYQFKNSEELYNELLMKMETYFYSFLLDNEIEDIPKYKQIGINYIKFAKEETNIFKALFMKKNNLVVENFIGQIKEFKEIEKFVKVSTNLKNEEIKSFHVKMWIFTHGLATLIASNTINFNDQQIRDLLSYEFQALMLLEENPNNKWVLKKGEIKW